MVSVFQCDWNWILRPRPWVPDCYIFRAFMQNPEVLTFLIFRTLSCYVRWNCIFFCKRSKKMVEHCQKLSKKKYSYTIKSTYLSSRLYLEPFQGTPFRYLPGNTPSRFRNQYSAFPFPWTHSKRRYISGLLRNICTLSWVLDYAWKHCRYDHCSCQPNTAKVTSPAQIEDKVQVQVYPVVTGAPQDQIRT